MGSVFLALFGVWMVATGYRGNAGPASSFIMAQRGFVAWMVAVLILYALYDVAVVRPVIKPLITLALVVLIVYKWPVILKQWNVLKSATASASAQAATPAAPASPYAALGAAANLIQGAPGS